MFKSVLKKGKIGKVEIKNRFVMPPMGTNKGSYDGFLTDNLKSYYVERAKGGFGLIVVEFAAVDPLGKALPEQLLISDDKFIDKFKELTNSVHKEGGKIFLQIHHAGRQTVSQITGSQPLAPSAIACPSMQEIPKALTDKEVYSLIEKFGDAALRAKKAGFDGVEVHGAHGYLVGQFLSAYSNKRQDEFGGDVVSRSRFAIEIIKNIKQKCSADYPVCVRLSGDERIIGGMRAEETAAIASLLQKAGADAIHVSTGVYGALEWTIAPSNVPSGFNLDDTRIIKKAVSVPVIAVGRIVDPAIADKIVEEGTADFVSLGRGSLADPYLPKKLADGNSCEVLQCVGCMTRCQGVKAQESDHGVSCMVNPFAGFEDTRKITPASKAKNIVVVGGGPAGLEASWILAARGHKVTLFEKSQELGGQFVPASVPPGKQDLINSIKFYVRMCKKYNVDIKLGIEADENLIAALNPDEVVLATGAIPLQCGIPNSDIPVVHAIDILNGVIKAGQNVLIVGGGLAGLETAEHLVSQNRKVSIVEMQDEIGKDMHFSTKYFVLKTLKDNNVNIFTGTKVDKISAEGASCVNLNGIVDLKGYDMVVWASGMVSYNPLQEKLKDKVKSIHVIGDALQPRSGVTAIDEGARLGLSL